MSQKKQSFYDTYHIQNRNAKYSKVISHNDCTYYWTIRQLDTALSLFPKDKKLKILDVGCGVGTIDLFLAAQGHSVKGIDISQKAIDICTHAKKETGLKGVEFVCTSVEEMKVTETFDLIICSEVIEHVKQDQKLLNMLSTRLKKNGVLLLTTPSLNAPLYRLGYLRDFDQRVGHLRRYTLDLITQKVEKAGFEVVKTYKTESILRNSLYTFPILGYLIKGLKGSLVPMFHVVDNFFVVIFGESDLGVIAKKQI